MSQLLKSKNIIITGASRGIGKRISSLFAQQGANIAFTHISSEEEGRKLEQELEKFGTKSPLFIMLIYFVLDRYINILN